MRVVAFLWIKFCLVDRKSSGDISWNRKDLPDESECRPKQNRRGGRIFFRSPVPRTIFHTKGSLNRETRAKMCHYRANYDAAASVRILRVPRDNCRELTSIDRHRSGRRRTTNLVALHFFFFFRAQITQKFYKVERNIYSCVCVCVL